MAERIFEKVDRPLFEEATACFCAGALRASYIMAWISVAESLLNRFSAMAERGDGQAGKVLRDVRELEGQNKATDLHLLHQAEKLGLVTDEQHEKLGHLREMRNRYAHPTGRGPTKQETLAALEIAVDALLSQPTRLRHGYADYQLAALFGDPHWLPDDEQAVRENAAGVASRLHPAAAPHLLEGLVKKYEGVLGDPERDSVRRRAGWFAGGFLAEARPDLSEPRWKIVDLVLKRSVAASLVLGTPEAFGLLPEQARGMVLGHLTQPAAGSGPSAAKLLGLQQARALSAAGLLSAEQRELVGARVEEASYRALQSAGVPLETYADRLLGDLSSHTWDRQNKAAAALGNAGPDQVRALRKEVQEQLGRNVLQAAQGSSHSAQGLIGRVRSSPSSWPEPFVRGLLLETLVNDDGRFRLKADHLADVLYVALSRESFKETLGQVTAAVLKSRPKTSAGAYLPGKGWVNQYDETVAILEGTLKDVPAGNVVQDLIEAVRLAKPEEETGK